MPEKTLFNNPFWNALAYIEGFAAFQQANPGKTFHDYNQALKDRFDAKGKAARAPKK